MLIHSSSAIAIYKATPQNKRTNRLSLLVLLVWLGLRAYSDFARLPLLVNRQRNHVNRRRRWRLRACSDFARLHLLVNRQRNHVNRRRRWQRRLLTRNEMSTHNTTVNALKARSATQLHYLPGSHLFLHTALRARHAFDLKKTGSRNFF